MHVRRRMYVHLSVKWLYFVPRTFVGQKPSLASFKSNFNTFLLSKAMDLLALIFPSTAPSAGNSRMRSLDVRRSHAVRSVTPSGT